MRIPRRLHRLALAALLALVPATLRAQQQPSVQATPDSAFAVSKNGSSLLRVNQDGKVGIGTSTPDRTLTVNGTIGASDTIATGVGIRFPDGTLQTTAAANAVGTSSNTPNTLVKRDSTGSFAAGKVTLDSLAVTGHATLGTTNVSGRISASDTVSTGAAFRFPDGSIQTTAAATATGVSTNTPNTIVGRDANGSFAAGKITLDSLAVAGVSHLGTTRVTGVVSASDTVASGVGFRFPDGSVQTTAAATATGTSSNTPNTIVGRDANGSFAASKITLDSLTVSGVSHLGTTRVTGVVSASDTVASGVGFRFPDGSVQTTAAATATGTSTNTPNTIVGRDANGSFASSKITLDSLAVSGVSHLGTTRVTGVVSASDTVASGVGFRFPDGSVQTTAAATATGTSTNTPNTIVGRDANGSFASSKITLDSLAVSGVSHLGTTAVTGQVTASDTVTSSAGFRFPDGSVQVTAATTATGTSANTPNTLVQRDANGSFAAGKVTLDSLAVAGRSTLGATAAGRLSASDTISTTVGIKFPDGSVQTTAAAAAATGTSANTPNTLVQRDASGSFSAGKVTLDSMYVNGRTQLGGGDVIVENNSALSAANDSVLTVRTGSGSRFRVNRDGGVLAVGTYDSGTSGSIPVEGSGTRMMWYPGKAAFRVGGINGTQWDDANIGLYSMAFGEDVRALGDNSLAVGQRAVAAGSRTLAMGEDVTATGANSVVLGYKASTSTGAGSPRLGTFVFGDRSTSTTGDTVHATTTNAAFWRVTNGFYIWTASNLASGVAIQSGSSTTSPWCSIANAVISASNCAYLSSGGTWTNSSDRNRKHGFADVSGDDVLARLRTLPITTWTYNSDPDAVRHLGPMAQDFHAAFGLGGTDDTHIATVDADGVALAAVKALDARAQAQQTRIDALERENAELRARLDRIERMLEAQAARP